MATTTASAMAAMSRDDEQIQRDVLAELKRDARVLPNEIGVAAESGVVTLVNGVKAVANEIEVRLAGTAYGLCP